MLGQWDDVEIVSLVVIVSSVYTSVCQISLLITEVQKVGLQCLLWKIHKDALCWSSESHTGLWGQYCKRTEYKADSESTQNVTAA